MYYYAIDGIEVGKQLERLITHCSDEQISEFSEKIRTHIELLSQLLRREGAQIIFETGDGVLAKSQARVDIRTLPLKVGSICFSVGVGGTALEASIAMRLAKSRGDETILEFPWSGTNDR
jgi:hypothetical protein